MTDLYQRGNHPEGVRAICKECERVVLKESESEAWDVVEMHNEQQHGGEDVAGVCAWDVFGDFSIEPENGQSGERK